MNCMFYGIKFHTKSNFSSFKKINCRCVRLLRSDAGILRWTVQILCLFSTEINHITESPAKQSTTAIAQFASDVFALTHKDLKDFNFGPEHTINVVRTFANALIRFCFLQIKLINELLTQTTNGNNRSVKFISFEKKFNIICNDMTRAIRIYRLHSV